VNRNCRAQCKTAQFLFRMVDQALYVSRVKLTRYDCEPAFCRNDMRARWDRLRHLELQMTNARAACSF
jgi:hypothetical protein